MSARMLAAAIGQFGGTEQLHVRDIALPVAGRGQIVVQVAAASVNPIDTRRRTGYGRRMMKVLGAAHLPLVLGNDFAGTVCAVGRGVTAFREGDAVFGAKAPSSQGSHATHVVLDAGLALHQPARMRADLLATLPYNFLTVARALAGAGITGAGVAGRDVLVHGASGGLGLIALRMLHTMGVRVTAVAGERGHACIEAGAHCVLNRHTQPLRTLPRKFAATLNFATWDDEAALLRLLAPGALGHATTVHPMLGQIDQHGLLMGAAGAWREKRRMAVLVAPDVRYAWTVFRPDPAALRQLANFAPQLQLPTDPVSFTLAQAAQAHRHVEQQRPGRAILLPQMT